MADKKKNGADKKKDEIKDKLTLGTKRSGTFKVVTYTISPGLYFKPLTTRKNGWVRITLEDLNAIRNLQVR
jgi:hypothetical protein